jgi:hypothetical protein
MGAHETVEARRDGARLAIQGEKAEVLLRRAVEAKSEFGRPVSCMFGQGARNGAVGHPRYLPSITSPCTAQAALRS